MTDRTYIPATGRTEISVVLRMMGNDITPTDVSGTADLLGARVTVRTGRLAVQVRSKAQLHTYLQAWQTAARLARVTNLPGAKVEPHTPGTEMLHAAIDAHGTQEWAVTAVRDNLGAPVIRVLIGTVTLFMYRRNAIETIAHTWETAATFPLTLPTAEPENHRANTTSQHI